MRGRERRPERRERRRLTGRRRPGYTPDRRADRAQRPLLVRLRAQVQEVSRGADRPAAVCDLVATRHRRSGSPSSLAAGVRGLPDHRSRATATRSVRRTRSSSSAPPSSTAGRRPVFEARLEHAVEPLRARASRRVLVVTGRQGRRRPDHRGGRRAPVRRGPWRARRRRSRRGRGPEHARVAARASPATARASATCAARCSSRDRPTCCASCGSPTTSGSTAYGSPTRTSPIDEGTSRASRRRCTSWARLAAYFVTGGAPLRESAARLNSHRARRASRTVPKTRLAPWRNATGLSYTRANRRRDAPFVPRLAQRRAQGPSQPASHGERAPQCEERESS